MLHCLNTSGNLAGSCSDMTVLERQRSRMKFPQEQGYLSALDNATVLSSSLDSGSSLADVVAPPSIINPDPSSAFQNGWPKLDKFVMGFGSSGLPPPPPVSRTYSCPPVLPDSNLTTDSANKINSCSSLISKKRKADKPHTATKGVAENDNKGKRNKVGAEDGGSKITGQRGTTNNNNNSTTPSKSNTQNCADNSKENSKASDPKPDYIHVRARRGQATDSHSLAERVRREKISERMKYLQDLVPGCNKITGKAGMLDEIINYVQSLQRQVEFLSMKLAAVNPRLDFKIDDLFAKEVFPACAASFPAIGMSSSDMANPAYLHFNPPQQQIVSGCGLGTGISPPDMSLRRSISAPVSLPETFVDSSCFTQILPSSTWEGDFQNLYNVAFEQARPPPSFPSQLFTGLVEPSNLKMQM